MNSLTTNNDLTSEEDDYVKNELANQWRDQNTLKKWRTKFTARSLQKWAESTTASILKGMGKAFLMPFIKIETIVSYLREQVIKSMKQ